MNGLHVGADISPNIVDISINKSTFPGSTVILGYGSEAGLWTEGGIKSFSPKLNDASNQNTNLEYDSFFLNGYFNFWLAVEFQQTFSFSSVSLQTPYLAYAITGEPVMTAQTQRRI